MKEIYIGTSGYNYRHWRDNVFYPKGLPQSRYLEFYCTRFNSVELNVTFYRLPSIKAFEGWERKTPKGFSFAVKGNRYITHIKRLKDTLGPLKNFSENLSPLRKKTSCILWQLPPGFKADAERLKNFIRDLEKSKFTKSLRHAFEFRHSSWFVDEIYNILRDNNFCLCIADLPKAPHIELVTADFIYMRLHGSKLRYSSNYPDSQLKDAARKAKKWLSSRKALYIFFNNDAHGYAPKNAVSLRGFISKRL